MATPVQLLTEAELDRLDACVSEYEGFADDDRQLVAIARWAAQAYDALRDACNELRVMYGDGHSTVEQATEVLAAITPERTT